MNLIKAPGERGSGPFSFERLAIFPPQADHVLVVFFFIRGRRGGAALKAPDNVGMKMIHCCTHVTTLPTTLEQALPLWDPVVPPMSGSPDTGRFQDGCRSSVISSKRQFLSTLFPRFPASLAATSTSSQEEEAFRREGNLSPKPPSDTPDIWLAMCSLQGGWER